MDQKDWRPSSHIIECDYTTDIQKALCHRNLSFGRHRFQIYRYRRFQSNSIQMRIFLVSVVCWTEHVLLCFKQFYRLGIRCFEFAFFSSHFQCKAEKRTVSLSIQSKYSSSISLNQWNWVWRWGNEPMHEGKQQITQNHSRSQSVVRNKLSQIHSKKNTVKYRTSSCFFSYWFHRLLQI